MDKRNTLLISILLILGVVGFGYVFVRSLVGSPATPPETTQTATDTLRMSDRVITAKHAYKNGEHLIAGSITLPTSCHILDHTVTILPDNSRATIAFTRSFSGTDCPGGEMETKFLVRFRADEHAVIRATLDGHDVTLSLIEAGPTEDLEKTEIFMKG